MNQRTKLKIHPVYSKIIEYTVLIYLVDHVLGETTVVKRGYIVQADEFKGPRQSGHAQNLVLTVGAVRFSIDKYAS
jgi:hypothetical protein